MSRISDFAGSLGHAVRPHWSAFVVPLAATAVVIGWLWFTPEGVMGKADAIGYAVCHRIPSHSLTVNGQPLPLCARCSGMYLGAFLAMALAAAAGRARASGLPPLRVSAVLLAFVVIMGVDGVNSYSWFFPGLPHAYEPQNWLRLTTGMFAGLAIGIFVLPSFNGTLWQQPSEQPILADLKELGVLSLVAALVVGLILTDNPVVMYTLAILSSLTVLLLLALIHLTLWSSLLQRANRIVNWRGLTLPLIAGLTLAVGQVWAIDLLRLTLTGTWAGFNL
jgi:uncharacterized membrane protein